VEVIYTVSSMEIEKETVGYLIALFSFLTVMGYFKTKKFIQNLRSKAKKDR